MTWLLLIHGAVAASGTRAQVLDLAEERGVVRVDTAGAHTGDPAYLPRLLTHDARILVAAERVARRVA